MRLTAVTLHRFRGYRDETCIPVDAFTALVGRNDIGKSSILEALDIFLDGGTFELDKADLCRSADGSCVRIGCTFDVAPDAPVVLDDSAPTTLADEYLLNEDGRLEIIKEWDCGASKLAPKVFVRAYHPGVEPYHALHAAKQEVLRRLVQHAGLAAQCDLTTNASMRRALWASVPELERRTREIRIDGAESRALWERLRTYLPEYALFRADRASSTSDAEVQDPLKAAVKLALRDVGSELEVVRQRVMDGALAIAQATVDKLRSTFPDVAGTFTPRLKESDFEKAFKLELDESADVPIRKRGSGVRRLMLLSFFLAEVDRTGEQATRDGQPASRPMIYAVEEPETGQHPANQVLILDALQTLAGARDQVLITTHNPALAARLPTSALRLVTRGAAGRPEVRGGDEPALFDRVARELGVLPDPLTRPARGVRVALVVEGPTDEDALIAFSRILFEAGEVWFSLERVRDQVFTVIGGGSNLQHWVNRRQLDKLDLPQVHLYDSDREGADRLEPNAKAEAVEAAVRRLNARPGVRAFVTRRRCIDNYLHLGCVAAVTGEPVACDEDPAYVKMDKLVTREVFPAMSRRRAADRRPDIVLLDPAGEEIPLRDKRAKHWIASQFMPLMTAAQIREVAEYADPAGGGQPRHELLEWLWAIGEHLDASGATDGAPGVPSSVALPHAGAHAAA